MTAYHLKITTEARPLEARSLSELAELVDCAHDAGDTVAWVRHADGQQLADQEFAQLLAARGGRTIDQA